jgi:hypothetical protein
MKVAENRNYWLAMICCLATSVMTLMVSDGANWEWLVKGDINVALWLFLAWLFDDKR